MHDYEEISCLSCNNVLDSLFRFNISIYDLSFPPIKIINFDETLECNKCKNQLEAKTKYVFNEDLEELYKKVAEQIGNKKSEYIEYCSRCNGEEIEYREYIYRKEFDYKGQAGIEVYEFLNDDVDEHLQKYVIEYLVCQNCKYGSEDDYMEKGFDSEVRIYSKRIADDFFGINYGLDLEKLNEYAEIHNKLFTKKEIDSFINFLMEKPTLGSKHDFGKKLYDVVQDFYDSDSEIKNPKWTLGVNEVLYRGRVRSKDRNPYGEKELWGPPKGVSSHGRYNTIGTVVFYAMNNYVGLPYELNPTKKDVIDYAKFKVDKKLELLNISDIMPGIFKHHIFSEVEESSQLKEGYLLTNYISNCCKDVGYDGIIYRGLTKKVFYTNYALFDAENKLTLEGTGQLTTDLTYETSKIRNNMFE